MYMRSTQSGGVFSTEVVEVNPGFVAMRVMGKKAFDCFRQEAGGHRFQRVPPTEKRGRRQSSTVTVAVLPEVSLRDAQVDLKDVKIETYRASGPGGQHRNTTDTAVRATHIPSQVTACATSKSQHQNRETALAVLASRIAQINADRLEKTQNKKRRKQIGSGMRSDKIRTVAEQRGRVENHLNGKRMKIDAYFRGELEKILE